MKLSRMTGSVLAALLLGAACAAPSSQAQSQQPTPEQAPEGAPLRLYVPNQSDATVSIIDAASGAEIALVDLKALGFSPNAKPHHVVVEPDGSYWYVSLIGDNTVVKLDRDNQVAGRAEMGIPGMLALDPVHGRLYASRSMSAVNAPASIGVIRTSDMTLLEELDVVLPRPHAIAVDTLSGRVYVGGLGTNQIATVDPETGDVALTSVDGPPHAFVMFAVSPDGSRLVASTQLTSKVLAFDASNPGTLQQVASVDVAPWPYQIVFAPDGRSVWMGNQLSGSATVVDATTWKVAGVVKGDGFAEPHGVAVTPDGETVFISSHGVAADSAHAGGMQGMHAGESSPRGVGTVTVIDAETHQVREVIPVGHYAVGIGIGGGL